MRRKSSFFECVASPPFFVACEFSLFFYIFARRFFHKEKHRHRSDSNQLQEMFDAVSTRLKQGEFGAVEVAKNEDMAIVASDDDDTNHPAAAEQNGRRSNKRKKTNARGENLVERFFSLNYLSRWTWKSLFLLSTWFGRQRLRITVPNSTCEIPRERFNSSSSFFSFFSLLHASLSIASSSIGPRLTRGKKTFQRFRAPMRRLFLLLFVPIRPGRDLERVSRRLGVMKGDTRDEQVGKIELKNGCGNDFLA